MQANPKVAIIIGILPEDPIGEIVEELAVANNFAFFLFNAPRDAVNFLQTSPELGSNKTFILLCSEFVGGGSIEQCTAELYTLRVDAAQIIIYALDIEWSGQLALDCIKAGARDYLVRGSYDQNQLRERIRHAMQGTPAPPYNINIPPVEEDGYAFVVTPFGPPLARDDYLSGIVVALESLNIRPLLTNEERRPTLLQRDIFDQIDNSMFVIANISQYRQSANANIYFELGYAVARNKPVILVQRANERKIPSDIQGIEYIEYVNCADLALKLYFGLRHYFEPSWFESPYTVGTPITNPDMLYGQRNFLNELIKNLAKNSLFLKGKRRIGKSSILASLKQHAPDNFMFISIQLQEYDGREKSFWSGVHQEICEEASRRELNVCDAQDSESYNELKKAVEQLMSEWISQKGRKARLVFLFDEAEVINNFTKETQSNLRSLLVTWHPIGVRAIFAGASNKLGEISSSDVSPLYNIVTELAVPSLNKSAMRKLIVEPAKGKIAYTEGAIDFIIEKADGYGYYAQAICHYAFVDSIKNRKNQIIKADVVRAYEQNLLSPDYTEFRTRWDALPKELQAFLLKFIDSPNHKMTNHICQFTEEHALLDDSGNIDLPQPFTDWIRRNNR